MVGAFIRMLDWLAHLLPVPGLPSLVGIVNAIVRAATTYIDETILSYNLARGDYNPWRVLEGRADLRRPAAWKS